jgi:phage I-like protein
MTTPRSLATFDAVATDSIVAADGSIWSHAASLGTYVKGTQFTIDRPKIENFIRVFASGYPRKVPVDYDHSSTNGAAGNGEPVPKAGDVLELRGVFAPADFTGELKAAAQKLADQAGRAVDDPQNLGLWMRWRPTNRALGMIREREYTDLSITFGPVDDKTTGAPQGDVLIAVALTNLPFIDTMLPVAASRDHGGTRAAPGERENTMGKITMLAAAAALIGKPGADEDQAAAGLMELHAEVPRLRQLATDVGAELGESDPTKLVGKVKELKAQNTAHELAATRAREAAIRTSAEAKIKTYEKKLTVPMRALMLSQLVRELTAGAKLEETDAVKALDSMQDLGITERSSGADVDDPNKNDPDRGILKRVNELMEKDEEIRELRKSDGYSAAFSLACDKAEAEELATSRK